MKGLAESTGVSRQLVYGHFPDTGSLLVEVLHRLFEHSRRATEEILSQAAESEDGDVVRTAYQVYFDLAPGPRRALRSLSAGDAEPPELRQVRRVMRRETLALWVPYVRRRTGLDRRSAAALAWMFVTASWGLADLVEDGDLSAAAAKDLLSSFAQLSIVRDAVATKTKRRKSR